MHLPTSIHIRNRSQVNKDKWNIRLMLKRMLRAGITGTNGTRNFPLGGFCLCAPITRRPTVDNK